MQILVKSKCFRKEIKKSQRSTKKHSSHFPHDAFFEIGSIHIMLTMKIEGSVTPYVQLTKQVWSTINNPWESIADNITNPLMCRRVMLIYIMQIRRIQITRRGLLLYLERLESEQMDWRKYFRHNLQVRVLIVG